MSINVQAYGAPARLTLRDYELASTTVTPHAPPTPAPQAADKFVASDRTAAASTSYADSMRAAALRRDAAAPGVGPSDRAKTATADTVVDERS